VAIERAELGIASSGIRHRQGRLRESVAAATTAGEEAARVGFRRGLGRSLYLRHINSVYLNEPDDSLGEAALAIFVELGDLVGQGNALNNLGISAYWAGAWSRALERYAASRDARERTGDLVGAATEENNIGEILSDQGHYEQAGTRFAAARSAWRAARYPVGEAVVTANLGRLAARTGRIEDGARLLGEAIAAFEAIHASSFVAETEAFLLECTLLGGDAATVAGRAAELAARLAGRGGYERPHAWALWMQGVALARLGRDGEAEPVLDDAVTCLRATGDLYGLALALHDRGSLRRRRGGAGAAGDDSESAELLERLGVNEAARVRDPSPPASPLA
jgi:tetratricopeptide (TPR) repeat protein